MPLVALCAKLGIARRILHAEGSGDLRLHDDNRTIPYYNVAESAGHLARWLRSNARSG
jgi:hypothetical protein